MIQYVHPVGPKRREHAIALLMTTFAASHLYLIGALEECERSEKNIRGAERF